MLNLYNTNGLIFWNEKQIKQRTSFVNYFEAEVKQHLLEMNGAWRFEQVEAPLLTPYGFVNQGYTEDDLWVQPDGQDGLQQNTLVLRPETTMGSFEYAKHLLNPHNAVKTRFPLVVWQAGKSFRCEQDLVTKHMRLKEFYQLEFQCIYGLNTANDYHANILEPLKKSFIKLFGDGVQLVESDRLPDYSEKTMDIEFHIQADNRNMELCSISKRKDFDNAHVLEIAIGLDRLLYVWERRDAHRTE